MCPGGKGETEPLFKGRGGHLCTFLGGWVAVCAVGPGVQGHGDPGAAAGSTLALGTPALPDVCTAALRPGEVAVADVPGAAGGLGCRAMWKFSGLGEHLHNWLQGEVGRWMVRGQDQTERCTGRQGGAGRPSSPDPVASSRCLAGHWAPGGGSDVCGWTCVHGNGRGREGLSQRGNQTGSRAEPGAAHPWASSCWGSATGSRVSGWRSGSVGGDSHCTEGCPGHSATQPLPASG